MNAERLHAIVLALRKETTERRTFTTMQTMVGALQAVVNQSNSGTQHNLAASLDALYAALTDTDSDKFSPAWRQILCEIGGERFFGKALKERVATAGGAYIAFYVCAPRTRGTSLSPRHIRGLFWLLNGRPHKMRCRRQPPQAGWRRPLFLRVCAGGAYITVYVCAPRTRATSLLPRPIRGLFWLPKGRRHKMRCRCHPRLCNGGKPILLDQR